MRRTLTAVVLVLLMSAPLLAQSYIEEIRAKDSITQGEFAQMVMDIALGYEEATPDPETALEKLQGWGIAPATWDAATPLTHGDLAVILHPVGIEHMAPKPDAPVSGTFVEALLWREVGKLKDYMAKRLGHGLSANHVIDAGVDRAVSPMDFD